MKSCGAIGRRGGSGSSSRLKNEASDDFFFAGCALLVVRRTPVGGVKVGGGVGFFQGVSVSLVLVKKFFVPAFNLSSVDGCRADRCGCLTLLLPGTMTPSDGSWGNFSSGIFSSGSFGFGSFGFGKDQPSSARACVGPAARNRHPMARRPPTTSVRCMAITISAPYRPAEATFGRKTHGRRARIPRHHSRAAKCRRIGPASRDRFPYQRCIVVSVAMA